MGVDADRHGDGLSPDTPRGRNLTTLFSSRDQPSSGVSGLWLNVLEVEWACEQHRRCARTALMALACFHMLENTRDCPGVGDFANHTKLAPTVGTHSDVDIEHAL